MPTVDYELVTSFVALGANLPSAIFEKTVDTLEWSVAEISRWAPVCGRSSWYRTAPIPTSDQPDFINGVVAVRMSCAPLEALRRLQAIEHAAGRVRTVANAARVLDLDLLAAGREVVQSPELTLPHPRMADRAFVLVPLAEIAPQWRHPVLGQTAEVLARRVAGQRIQRLGDGSSALHVPSLWIT